MTEMLPETIARAARLAHEANRGYCRALGDHSQMPWEEAPEWQRFSAINGATSIALGVVKNAGDSHRFWMIEKQREGWIWGPIKDPERKEHPCMVPFEDLPPEQRAKDYIFLAVVRAVLEIPNE